MSQDTSDEVTMWSLAGDSWKSHPKFQSESQGPWAERLKQVLRLPRRVPTLPQCSPSTAGEGIRRTISPPRPAPLTGPAAHWSAARCCSAARTRVARISASTWGLRRRGDTGSLVTGDGAEGGELEGEWRGERDTVSAVTEAALARCHAAVSCCTRHARLSTGRTSPCAASSSSSGQSLISSQSASSCRHVTMGTPFCGW
eukprot:scaffold31606_cov33-Phaeocystis_antarctica.AAC.2